MCKSTGLKNSMDIVLNRSTFVILCMLEIIVRQTDGVCTPTVQRCQNCFWQPAYGCITNYDGSTEVICTQHLNATMTMVAFNENYPSAGSATCWYVTCGDKQIGKSSYSSTLIRTGGCGGGCSNVTLNSYSSEGISQIADETFTGYSHVDCIELAVEMAFNGTDTSVMYSSDTDTCQVFTSCPSGGCTRVPSSYDDKVDVVTCDYNAYCGTLNAPVNGAVTMSDAYKIGSVATFSCDVGFELTNNVLTKECSSKLNWTPATVPTCQPEATTAAPTTSTEAPTTTTALATTTTAAPASSTTAPPTVSTPVVALKGNLYIRSCLCRTENSSFQGLTQEEIIEQLIKDTQIDASSTALAQQKLQSISDPRQSSKIIGTVGVAFISVIFGLFLILDCLSLYQRIFHPEDTV